MQESETHTVPNDITSLERWERSLFIGNIPDQPQRACSVFSPLIAFLAAGGRYGCSPAFSSCGQWGLFSGWCAWASHSGGLSACGAWAPGCTSSGSCSPWACEHRLRACGARAQLLHGMWDPEPPASAGALVTTGPPGECHSLRHRAAQAPHQA